jgi:hypothetical protein
MPVVVAKVSVEFDSDDIGMDTEGWTEEDLKSYYASTLVEDITYAMKYNELEEMITVEIKEGK